MKTLAIYLELHIGVLNGEGKKLIEVEGKLLGFLIRTSLTAFLLCP